MTTTTDSPLTWIEPKVMLPVELFEERVRKILREEIDAAYEAIKADALLNGWPKVNFVKLPIPSCNTCADTGRIWITCPETTDQIMWKSCPECTHVP